MLGSPSFHGYRDTSGGSGKPNLELGNRIYYEDQAYSVSILTVVITCFFIVYRLIHNVVTIANLSHVCFFKYYMKSPYLWDGWCLSRKTAPRPFLHPHSNKHLCYGSCCGIAVIIMAPVVFRSYAAIRLRSNLIITGHTDICKFR